MPQVNFFKKAVRSPTGFHKNVLLRKSMIRENFVWIILLPVWVSKNKNRHAWFFVAEAITPLNSELLEILLTYQTVCVTVCVNLLLEKPKIMLELAYTLLEFSVQLINSRVSYLLSFLPLQKSFKNFFPVIKNWLHYSQVYCQAERLLKIMWESRFSYERN